MDARGSRPSTCFDKEFRIQDNTGRRPDQGCSGQQYNLEYTSKKEKFDEEIKQDGTTLVFFGNVPLDLDANTIPLYAGVTVLVDNKALLSVRGSERDMSSICAVCVQ